MRMPGTSRRPLSPRKRIVLVIAAAVTALLGGTLAAVAATGSPAASGRAASGGAASGGVRAAQGSAPYIFIHDPAMAREGGTYYVFSTGDPAGSIGNGNIQIRTSPDLRSWTYAGTVFAAKPTWITTALGDIPNLWAPDISYFGGRWHLYYAGSSFGSNNSVIGLATTPTLDPRSPRYHWTDDGLVFRTTSADNFNAIDPSLVTAKDGGRWLVLGSFFSGIKMIPLDAATGKPGRVADCLSAGSEAVPRPGGRGWHHLPRRVLLPVRLGR